MASTYSQNLKLELMGAGDQSGIWGDTTNTNLGTTLEEAIVGYGAVQFTNDTNLTLTLSNSNTTQLARNFFLYVTSTVSLSATRDLIVPTIRKPYVVQNATTGGQSIQVKTAAGTGIVVPNGKKMLLYVDGTNVIEEVNHFGGVSVTGDLTAGSASVTGALTAGSASLTSPLGVSSGGTGLSSPGASGNVLVSNGTSWVPSASVGEFENRIINGNMLISQRGAYDWITGYYNYSASIGAYSYAYTTDRFVYVNGTSSVVTVSTPSDFPNNQEFNTSLRVAVTTADTSIGATEYAVVTQPIEGFNALGLSGRTFTLSFWVRSSKTGVHCISLTDVGVNRKYVAEYTVSTANTWEFKSITVTGGLNTYGLSNIGLGAGLLVSWTLAAGSTYRGTANVWQQGGNFLFGTANQVNCLDTVGNIFAVVGIQLRIGSTSTTFTSRPYSTELMLCQRYYEIGEKAIFSGNVTNGSAYYGSVTFSVTKRAAEDAFNPVLFMSYVDRGNSLFPNATNPTPYDASCTGAACSKVANGTGVGMFRFDWRADAEITLPLPY
jgi:hypothetical protein